MLERFRSTGPAVEGRGRHRAWRTIAACLLVPTVIAGGSIVITSTPAVAQGVWAQATEVTAPANARSDPNAFFSGISCSSAGNCTAAGSYIDSSQNGLAMVATETSGTWAQATEVTAPANAGSNTDALFNGISCSSTGNCTAAGLYTDSSSHDQAMVATETSGTWAQATEVAAPSNAASDPGAFFYGISCSSAGNCTAAGGYNDSSGYAQAMAATETSGSWAQATEVTAPSNAGGNPGADFYGISCSSAGTCTAAGSYTDASGNNQLMAATEASGVWAQAAEVSAPSNAGSNPDAYFSGISCSSAGNCTAAGSYSDSSGHAQAMTATETSGSWAQATEVAAPANAGSDPAAYFFGISCSSTAYCTASGEYTDTSSSEEPMTATETSGTWAVAAEIAVPANAGSSQEAGLNGISCSSTWNCTAVGIYVDNSGNIEAMAATETLSPPTIDGVTFGGTPSDPTITVTGSGFGTLGDIGTPNPASTTQNCSPATGYDYGTSFYIWDQTDPHYFVAGLGPPSLAAVGVNISSYSNNKIVYTLGSCYSQNGWIFNPGDTYSMNVLGTTFTGIVSLGTGYTCTVSGLSGTTSFPMVVSESPAPPASIDAGGTFQTAPAAQVTIPASVINHFIGVGATSLTVGLADRPPSTAAPRSAGH